MGQKARAALVTRQLNQHPTATVKRQEMLTNPGFGQIFTDHMVQANWSKTDGWGPMELVPYGPLSLDPSTNFIHYGQSIFEGLKAYRHADGSIWAFRPEANAMRFQASARRLAMPELPTELFLASIEALVEVDQEWVPTDQEKSLYLRPFMFSTESGLGIRPANHYKYMLIASPSAAYFNDGVHPVSVWLSTEYVRAAPGGTGAAKFAGNYAASLLGQAQAAEKGCDQVVWLDAAERKYVEEMGGMNLCFVYEDEGKRTLVTPPLTGTLLPGVTRDSVLRLAASFGWEVKEEKVSVDQWQRDCASGYMTEVFACGTAAVVTPVGEVKSAVDSWTIGTGRPGPATLQMREVLLGIQNGEHEDSFGWIHELIPAR